MVRINVVLTFLLFNLLSSASMIRNCSASNFTINRNYTQILGLNHKINTKSLEECALACCSILECDSYNWCPPNTTSSLKGYDCNTEENNSGACYFGKSNGVISSPSTWLGAQRSPRFSCDGVLFVYFLSAWLKDGEQIRFALSRDGFHFIPLNNGDPIPPLFAIENSYVRDPFLNKDSNGIYRLVSTEGAGFGASDHILYWESKDLINWSKQKKIPVMSEFSGDVKFTWAPEWVWDPVKKEFLIFWAVGWQPGKEHFSSKCDNPVLDRFSFWGTYTVNWINFSKPTLLFDPHCRNSSFAPWKYGDGGIDADIMQSPDGKFYMYFKDTRAPEPPYPNQSWPGIQNTSGIRVSVSSDLKMWSIPKPNIGLVGPWGTEGPELLVVSNNTMHLYFDCVKMGSPPNHTKPPYGVATAPYPSGFGNLDSWQVVSGSCTGNNTQVFFPDAATHGSFICISDKEYNALEKVWGN